VVRPAGTGVETGPSAGTEVVAGPLASVGCAVGPLLDIAVGHIGPDLVTIDASPGADPLASHATAVEKAGPNFVHSIACPEPAGPVLRAEAAGVKVELGWVDIAASLEAVDSMK
jgi:hypothetical protein